MTGTPHLLFLWHMHQPPYMDPESGKAIMPWVRLHAVKGYYDMGCLLDEFPDVRMTFNFTPSLLAQLETFDDIFLDYTMKPAAEISPEDSEFLVSNFFFCFPETMIRPYPRFWELFKKRGKRTRGEHVRPYLASFSQSDLLDLQVWFNLAWMGFAAEKKNEGIGELKKKERSYSEDDKAYLISIQRKIAGEIIPLYRNLQDRGQIEISVSPFYHPILPLLCDTDLARRAHPGVPLPPRFSHPDDARVQIEKGIAFCEKIFGKRPQGMWPSEGSVSPEVALLMAEAGLTWAATDEGILFRSLQGGQKSSLYSPFVYSSQGKKIAFLFRDRGLSDAVSYTYCKIPSEDAVRDFAKRLDTIITNSDANDPCVAVILDGENPWEYYPGRGEKFLRELYRFLARGSVKTDFPSNYLSSHPPTGTLSHLATGSWIEGTFDIWIGQEEDNKGWGFLKMTRDFLVTYLESHPETSQDIREKAWDHIYQAEASDWFWWYGDQFPTEQDVEFDHLFRSHLMSVYQLLTGDFPQFLQSPICTKEVLTPAQLPTSFVTPKVDGEISSYFDWYGAGIYTPGREGAMRFRGKAFFSRLLYGFDRENLYLCLEPEKGKDMEGLKGHEIHVHILHKAEHKASITITSPTDPAPIRLYKAEDGVTFTHAGDLNSFAIKKVIEIAFPFGALDLHEGEKVYFVIEVKDGDRQVDRYPRQGYISFTVPTEKFEQEMWSV